MKEKKPKKQKKLLFTQYPGGQGQAENGLLWADRYLWNGRLRCGDRHVRHATRQTENENYTLNKKQMYRSNTSKGHFSTPVHCLTQLPLAIRTPRPNTSHAQISAANPDPLQNTCVYINYTQYSDLYIKSYINTYIFLSFFVYFCPFVPAVRLKKRSQRTLRSSARTKEDRESEKCYGERGSRGHTS